MRHFWLIVAITCLVGCVQQNQYDKVWSNYEWLPPGAEGSNPYAIPPAPYPSYRGNYPVYDNDSDYVQPYGWGVCGGANNLGNCE